MEQTEIMEYTKSLLFISYIPYFPLFVSSEKVGQPRHACPYPATRFSLFQGVIRDDLSDSY